MSSRYLHTYNLFYFHINTSDSYDETQDQVQRWVTFIYFQGHWLIKEKSLPSRYFRTNNLYYGIFHINTSDPYDKTQGQVRLFV